MMVTVRIYGTKGEILCKPFQVNTADDDPEDISEEKQIINYLASDSDKQEESEVATDTGNQGQ